MDKSYLTSCHRLHESHPNEFSGASGIHPDGVHLERPGDERRRQWRGVGEGSWTLRSLATDTASLTVAWRPPREDLKGQRAPEAFRHPSPPSSSPQAYEPDLAGPARPSEPAMISGDRHRGAQESTHSQVKGDPLIESGYMYISPSAHRLDRILGFPRPRIDSG